MDSKTINRYSTKTPNGISTHIAQAIQISRKDYTNLAPSDFHAFQQLKSKLGSGHFTNEKSLRVIVTDWVPNGITMTPAY